MTLTIRVGDERGTFDRTMKAHGVPREGDYIIPPKSVKGDCSQGMRVDRVEWRFDGPPVIVCEYHMTKQELEEMQHEWKAKG